MGLKIQLLGGFAVWRDDHFIEDWGSEQTKALLKIFLTEPGQPFLHDQLLEHLWPETDLKRALSFLRARIHSLRQTLEPETNSSYQYVQTCPGGYRFNKDSDAEIDVLEFLQHFKSAQTFREEGDSSESICAYENALELYQSEYLPEDRYEEWALLEREKWKRLHVSSLMGLADCYAREGRYRRAIDLCNDAIIEEKYREDIYRQAMIYCHLMGNSNEAHRIYQRCVQTISEGLGVEPDIETQKRADQIAEGHVPDLDPDYKPPSLMRHPVHHSLGRLPFVGREKELRSLLNRLKSVKDRAGGLILVGGEIGIGKSRLAQEIVQIVQRQHGYSILKGRSSELGGRSAYQAMIAAFRFHLAVLDEKQLLDLPKFSLAVLQHWFIGMDLSLQLPDAPPNLGPEEERLRLFEAVTQLLIGISENSGPILLWLDDLQWADPSSVDLLDYLLPRIEAHPCLVLGTYRSEDLNPGHHLLSFVQNAARDSADADRSIFELKRLNKGQIQEILLECSPEIESRDRLGNYLHKESEGNPLFLVSLMQSLFEEEIISVAENGTWVPDLQEIKRSERRELPQEIQQIIHTRIARLPAIERSLVECLSIVGIGAHRNILKSLWETHSKDSSEYEFLKLIESLERLHVLYTDHEGYHFSHDKIHEVVYDGIQIDLRTFLHKSLTQIFEDHYASSPVRPHEQFAYHYTKAEMPTEALADLLPALKAAVAGYRNSEALALAEDAMNLIEQQSHQAAIEIPLDHFRYEILKERLKVFHILGNRAEQEEDLGQIEQIVRDTEDNQRSAEAILLRSSFHIDMAEYDLAQAEAYKALSIAKDMKNIHFESRAYHNIGLIHWHTGDNEAAQEYFNQEYKLLSELNDDIQKAETLHYLSGISWRNGEYEVWEVQVYQSLELRDRNKDLPGKARTLLARGVMYWSKGSYLEAIETFEEIQKLAREIGDRRGEARALGNLGMVSRYLGRYEKSIDYINSSMSIHKEIGDKRAYATNINNLGIALLSVGAFKKAKELFQELLTISDEIGSEQSKAFALNNLGCVYWHQGETSEAIELGIKALEMQKEIGDQRNIGFVNRTLGEMYLDSGDFTVSLQHLSEALIISKTLNSSIEELLLQSDLCQIHLELGEIKQAKDYADAALNLLEKSENSQHLPRVKYSQYLTFNSLGDPENAHIALSEAYESLQNQAQSIGDQTLQLSFLHKVPLHQKILDARSTISQNHDLSEEECYELLRRIRWPKETSCTACASKQIREHGKVSNSFEKRYLCTSCKKTFGDRTDTMFANSNIPIRKLFQAILLVTDLEDLDSAKKAMKEQLEIHSRTANNLHKKIVDAMQSDPTIKNLSESLREENYDFD
jgi:tetratricopeptide (TPR) repeat protein